MSLVLNSISTVLQVLGSLAIFLFGMKIMSDGLQKAAGNKLQGTLNIMTKNRFVGVLTGTGITALIQSSSATTVMVVSFANAGLITLEQSISVIMGANIGTTVTAWIVSIASVLESFSILDFSIIVLAFMLPFMFSKKAKLNSIAESMIGLTLIFVGLDFISQRMSFVAENEGLKTFLSHFSGENFHWYHVLLFVLIGAVLTAIIQSSSAVTAICITLVVGGIFPFLPVAALVVGSNIGTTVTALLASIGTNTAAKRASLAHFLFNLAGAIWVLILFNPFVQLVEIISGPLAGALTPANATATVAATKLATIQVAVFHTLFNLINTALLIGFIGPFAKLVKKLIPQNPKELTGKYELKYISAGLQDTPEINLQNAKAELKKMAGITMEMLQLFIDLFHNPEVDTEESLKKLHQQEDYTDQMQEEISRFLQECDQENLTANSHHNIAVMIRISHELENVGDSCYNLGILHKRREEGKITYCAEAVEQLEPFIETTVEFQKFIYDHMVSKITQDELDVAVKLENKTDDFRSRLTHDARVRIQKGSDVKTELLYLDLLKHFEHIGDSSLNIAQELQTIK